MIEYLGNRELLKQRKTAFLASGTIPPEEVLPAYDWAKHTGREGHCVVSGFSSHLEQQVLAFLQKGIGAIILVLGRRMYKHVPEQLQPLLDAGRLLIIAVTDTPRQSKATAFARNRNVCQLADEIVMVGVTENSSLAQLKGEFSDKVVEL